MTSVLRDNHLVHGTRVREKTSAPSKQTSPIQACRRLCKASLVEEEPAWLRIACHQAAAFLVSDFGIFFRCSDADAARIPSIMSKHSFMDTILNRPSQRYTEPDQAKASRTTRYQTPHDLPNAPNKPDSILAGTMFTGAGPGALNQSNGNNYSRAPSVMSGKSNTSRFSIFRKKNRAPSVSGGSVYYDGASSVAPTDVTSSPRKGRWWESGTRNTYTSRPPSIAGSVFSEPEASGPPGFPRISDSMHANAPARGARSDYGGGSSNRKRYSSQPGVPVTYQPSTKASMSSMKRQSGVTPLGQQAPNLMRQASSASLVRSQSNATSSPDLNRPVSPAASMGRRQSQTRAAPSGSSDWNSFVKSMSGTEVAKMWEQMPTLAPKPPRTSEKRSSVVANRIRKELEQDAQFQQVQRDPGVVQQDLLARAASQVIGAMPPTPAPTLSEAHTAPLHLQPGQVVMPVSPVASNSSLNVAHYPPSMALQAPTAINGAGVQAPVVVPQNVATVPVVQPPQPPHQYVHPQAVAYPYSGAVPAEPLHQYTGAAPPVAKPQQAIAAAIPTHTTTASPPLQQPAPPVSAQTYAPVALPAPRAVAQASTSPSSVPAVLPPVANGAVPPVPVPLVQPSAPVAAPPTTAQYLADRIDEQESAGEQADSREVSSDESDDSDETSSEEGLVGGGQPTLDVVAEEDEELSSVGGHQYHHEMRSRKSAKGKGLSRNYGAYEAHLHSRQASGTSQQDAAREDESPVAPAGVSIQVTDAADLPSLATTSTKREDPTIVEAHAVAPALAMAPPQLGASDRPKLVSRASEMSDYQSAASDSGTATMRDRDQDDQDVEDADVAPSPAKAKIGTKTSRESMSTDAASIAPSQHQSVRTSRSSRPPTAQRRLSELSLGASFAASGILRRPESTRRRTGGSDSGAELSDDDADLRAEALAEQDRLRKMNVGEDFFGPSLSTILDKFDGSFSMDSSVSKVERGHERPSVPAASASDIHAEAQQVINEVRQNRADATSEAKKRNSTDTAGMAPSVAAIWLLNQAQGTNDSAQARAVSDDAGDETITSSILRASTANDVASPPVSDSPERPKVSVLNRPRPTPKRPREMGGVSIADGRLESDPSLEPAAVEDTGNTLPISVSQTSMQSANVSIGPAKSDSVLGKQRMADDANTSTAPPAAIATQQPNGMVPSETVNNFATPPQSMANLQGMAGAASSPEKFHTAHDLKALADTSIPIYPTESVQARPTPNGTAPADARPEHQRQLSEQIKSMDGFGSFALPQLDQRKAAAVPAVNGTTMNHAVEPSAPTDASPAPSLPQNASVNGVGKGSSSVPTLSEASVASTALTSPDFETAPKATQAVREVPHPALAAASSSPLEASDKKLPMPPPPQPEEVMARTFEDQTPTGKPLAAPGVGINLIPPTPPAMESRDSFTSSQVPGTPTIDEHDEYIAPQRPSLMSRSSSQRTAVRGDSKPDGASEGLSRSRSMAPARKGMWTEYKGKGLSLPPGLVATTIDSSALRRMSTQDKKAPSQPVAAVASDVATPVSPAPPALAQNVVTAPLPLLDSPARPARSTPSPSPKSKRSSGSLGGSPQRSSSVHTSPSMNRIMVDAPPVPQIPAGYQAPGSVSSSSSRPYAHSGAASEHGWDSRSASPAPSAVPSQSGRSVGSHVSSSVHSASYRSSPRPEYTYVNHHELSPYAKKMRSLSPSPAMPTLSQTGNRHSLMSAINEWESQVPEPEAPVAGLSPYPSRPVSPSPSPYPTLPASTVSRASSVISSVSSPAVVRNAPLGASTNQYLSPPIARSRMSPDELSTVSESAIESHNAGSVVGRPSGPPSASSSSPSASQSALSLSSTVQTSMPTVPTSYRPNKEPKRFSTNADDLLNSRTTMQTVAVTSGAFATRSKSVRRKKSVDLNGNDVPEHLQDDLAQTTLSVTAHTPPPRKIGSHQVLVQVIAVAIDEMDKLLLREKVRAENAFGFVPGRSFCGRIVECGYEVKKMRKGDVVFGLQDSRKSGALAEFMVVDHNRICHAPSDCLTTEQIAALPSAGVMAHQLIQNHCSQLQRGARVLILNAHDGIGLLTMQESVGLGLVIVAQCPPSISDGVAVCQANGAHEVVIGEPLWAINSLHESSFDLIVDTVGGRKIYDASRRILGTDGQFCTCFGDEHGTTNPNLRSHLRSLRRAFFKKDKKNIGYEWVGVDTAEDCKEALEAVKRAAEGGNICPRLRSVLPFADAGRAFDGERRNGDDEPGAIVVRVS
ncbi:PKS_ER domain-containing protein [Pseudozyma hubeiensis]|nr:PKS_ER domain-containing protein [Pseudozyma hubeiensis]